jgi:predicted nucleic acid-binding protein
VIVIDASTAVLALLTDGAARQLLMDESVAVPHLVDAEIAHALRGQVARGTMSDRDGARALQAWVHLEVSRFPARGLLARVWELKANLSAYDATCVALAEVLECPMVTADARISRAPGPRCPITVLPGPPPTKR